MKTTMIIRPIANPRRTTLAHLKDAEPLREEEQRDGIEAAEAAEAVEIPVLPRQTANPRRTVLAKLPAATSAELPSAELPAATTAE